jgi:hypothetical protein
MKKIIILGIICLFVGMVFQPAFANDNIISLGEAEKQPFDGAFMKTFGGTGYDSGRYVQQTSDGGYIITGETDGDVWLIKTDRNGNIEWDRNLGGRSSYCVQQTTDGGYIIVGKTGGDVWLIKTNITGDIEWDNHFGGADKDFGYYVQQTKDGGYIIVGETKSYGAGMEDVYLIKTDNSGNMLWNKTFGGAVDDIGYCVQQTSDDGYIITGFTYSFGWGDFNDIWLIKTDNNGDELWNKTFQIRTDWDEGRYVQQTTDGGYIITGYTQQWGYYWEVFLLKTDNAGNKIWSTTPGYGDIGYCVRQTTDGGYIITGGDYFTGGSDVLLIKTTSSGNKQWEQQFGGFKVHAIGFCVQQTTDGGFIVVGETGSYDTGDFDVYLIKTNKYGDVKSKAVTSYMLLLRILERFPLLERLYYLIRM